MKLLKSEVYVISTLLTWCPVNIIDKYSKNNLEMITKYSSGSQGSRKLSNASVSWRGQSMSGGVGFVSTSSSGWDPWGKQMARMMMALWWGSNSTLKLDCWRDPWSAKGDDNRKPKNLLNNRKWLHPPQKLYSWLTSLWNEDLFEIFFH